MYILGGLETGYSRTGNLVGEGTLESQITEDRPVYEEVICCRIILAS